MFHHGMGSMTFTQFLTTISLVFSQFLIVLGAIKLMFRRRKLETKTFTSTISYAHLTAHQRNYDYVAQNLYESKDPLITRIAHAPIHMDYMKFRATGQLPTATIMGFNYTSVHHINLLLLLHRLGLRGRVKYIDE